MCFVWSPQPPQLLVFSIKKLKRLPIQKKNCDFQVNHKKQQDVSNLGLQPHSFTTLETLDL